MADPLSDSSPLIMAEASCKLRLVCLLVEGGARVNGSDPGGATPLLAACRALRGEPAGPAPLQLLTYLLRNKVRLHQSPIYICIYIYIYTYTYIYICIDPPLGHS